MNSTGIINTAVKTFEHGGVTILEKDQLMVKLQYKEL